MGASKSSKPHEYAYQSGFTCNAMMIFEILYYIYIYYLLYIIYKILYIYIYNITYILYIIYYILYYIYIYYILNILYYIYLHIYTYTSSYIHTVPIVWRKKVAKPSGRRMSSISSRIVIGVAPREKKHWNTHRKTWDFMGFMADLW